MSSVYIFPIISWSTLAKIFSLRRLVTTVISLLLTPPQSCTTVHMAGNAPCECSLKFVISNFVDRYRPLVVGLHFLDGDSHLALSFFQKNSSLFDVSAYVIRLNYIVLVSLFFPSSECTRSGFCNFMHLKPISRELRRELYGRKRRGRR